MATGAIDANGIWQYGPDDLLSPWDAYMNKLGVSVSNKVAAQTNAFGSIVWAAGYNGGAIAGEDQELRKIVNNRVVFGGVQKSLSGFGSFNAFTFYSMGIAGAIPAGYRPTATQHVMGIIVIPTITNYHVQYLINTDGSITWQPQSTYSGATIAGTYFVIPKTTWQVP